MLHLMGECYCLPAGIFLSSSHILTLKWKRPWVNPGLKANHLM